MWFKKKKKQTGKLDFIKVKSLSFQRTLKRVKRQATDWNHTPDKGLIQTGRTLRTQ